ncbi:MAG: YbaK/EbsC family protein [Candidatus Paceibacterota bacterium]
MSKYHRNKILELVSGLDVKHSVHEPVGKSKEVSELRGVPLSSGAKAILVQGKKTYKQYLFVVPAHKRLHSKNVQNQIGEKFSFVSDVEKDFDCVPGSVPPFGRVLGLQTYADEDLEDVLNFNIGLLTESLQMKKEDYLKLENPIIGNFTE